VGKPPVPSDGFRVNFISLKIPDNIEVPDLGTVDLKSKNILLGGSSSSPQPFKSKSFL